MNMVIVFYEYGYRMIRYKIFQRIQFENITMQK